MADSASQWDAHGGVGPVWLLSKSYPGSSLTNNSPRGLKEQSVRNY